MATSANPITNIQNINQPNEPDLRTALDLHTIEVGLKYNCHAIGTIQSFDSSKQTARITINYQKTYFKNVNGENTPYLQAYPLLIDVPCIVLFGGSFSLKMPINSGDTCLVLFNDRNMDKWFQSGQTNMGVDNARLHSMSDGIALVGLNSLQKVLSGYEANKVVLGDGETDLKLGGGEAELKAGSTVIKAGEKITLENSAGSLGAILQQLIVAIQGITVTVSGVPTPINNIAAFDPIASDLGDLLE